MMPANGQKAAGSSISNLFGGFNQKLNALNNTGSRELSSTWDDSSMLPGHAPPNAAAAPTKGSNSLFTGLCDALNQHQQSLVQDGTYEVADEYVIQFAPAALGDATVTPPGAIVYGGTANQDPNTASAKLDPKTDAVNTNSQTWQVLAGTQIVQFIDQVMRGSSYIRDQQKAQIDADGKQVKSNPNSDITAWYKISVQATQLKYDNKRRSNAYRMTYVINTYAINQMGSPYFNDSKYRGAHKAYSYWFTGANTQVLNYEQEYNAAYYTTLTNDAGALVSAPPTGQDQFSKTFMATSEVRGQGQPGYVNNPADSAAAFLYSITDFQTVRLKIVGDPAWLQQGEIAVGVNAPTFNFTPFNTDGTINFDSSEVVFTLSFNRPTDYNFNTGVMDVNATNKIPQQNFAYMANSCKNTFSKGQFTQELIGSLLPLSTAANPRAAANGRVAAPAAPTASGSRSITSNSGNGYQDEASQNADGNGASAPSGYQNEEQQNADNGPPTPQPASPPGAPNSDGSIVGGSDTPPPKIDTNSPIQANAEETAAVQAYVAAGGTFPRGTGPITSGPLYDAVLSAKSSLAARQQASAVNTTPPQLIAKDDS